jgi:hypothetical protein
MSSGRYRAYLVPVTLGWWAAAAAEPAANAPAGTLQACVSISDDAARLACYDRLAGRSAAIAPAFASPPPSTQAAPVPPTQALPTTSSQAARLPATPTPGRAAVSAERGAAPAAASPSLAPPQEAFGLYSAEHPKAPPVAPALQAAVVSLGRSVGGRATVLLDGGAVWELEDPDPLLAVGDVVIISRASLGSYLMQTPSHRFHRVRRLH